MISCCKSLALHRTNEKHELLRLVLQWWLLVNIRLGKGLQVGKLEVDKEHRVDGKERQNNAR